MSDQNIFVHKIVLKSGKTVLIRDMSLKTRNLAAKIAGTKLKGEDSKNTLLLNSVFIDELTRLLLFQIDGKAPDPAALLDLDSILPFSEIAMIQKAIRQIAGMDEDDSEGKLQMEIESIGQTSLG